jgi:hypothetical protein
MMTVASMSKQAAPVQNMSRRSQEIASTKNNHPRTTSRSSSRNHAYAIKHKLRDCSLMKSFMAIGSLPRGIEVAEAPIKDNTTPFPREDVVMTVFGRSSPLEKHRTLDPSRGAPSHSG